MVMAWNGSDCAAGWAVSGTYNEIATYTPGSGGIIRGTEYISSGKKYWEWRWTNIGDIGTGLANASLSTTGWPGGSDGLWQNQGSMWVGSGNNSIYLTSLNDWVGICFDADANKYWAKNLTTGSLWNNDFNTSGEDPATGVGGFTPNGTGPFTIVTSTNQADVCVMNFGDTAFVGTPPSGFTALNGGGGGGGSIVPIINHMQRMRTR